MKQKNTHSNNSNQSQVIKLEKVLAVTKDEAMKADLKRRIAILKQNKPVTK